MVTQLNTKRILIFLAFAFGIAWAALLAFYLTGGMNNTVVRPDLALPLMTREHRRAHPARRLPVAQC